MSVSSDPFTSSSPSPSPPDRPVTHQALTVMDHHSAVTASTWPQATGPVLQQHLAGLAPAEWDLLLDDVSRQMAGSDLTRRRSARRHGPWSSVSSKEPAVSTRVLKNPSAGNSPMSSLARRTSTSGASIRRTPSNNHHPRSDPSLTVRRNRHGKGRALDQDRPTTWHPSSQLPHNLRPRPISEWGPQAETTSWPQGYPSGVVSLEPPSTPSLYPGSENISPVSHFNPYDFNEQDLNGLYGFDLMGPLPGAYSGLPYVSMEPAKFPTSFPAQELWGYPQESTISSLSYPSGCSPIPFVPSTNSPLAPTFLPIQNPDLSLNGEEPTRQLSRQSPDSNGKELVAMGLYDDVCPDPADAGFDDRYEAQLPSGIAVGLPNRPREKGLKLEETWEPPSNGQGDEERTPVRRNHQEGSGTVKPSPDEVLGPLVETSFLLDDGCLLDDSYFTMDGISHHPRGLSTTLNRQT